MVINEDIQALAKLAYELALLPEHERAARESFAMFPQSRLGDLDRSDAACGQPPLHPRTLKAHPERRTWPSPRPHCAKTRQIADVEHASPTPFAPPISRRRSKPSQPPLGGFFVVAHCTRQHARVRGSWRWYWHGHVTGDANGERQPRWRFRPFGRSDRGAAGARSRDEAGGSMLRSPPHAKGARGTTGRACTPNDGSTRMDRARSICSASAECSRSRLAISTPVSTAANAMNQLASSGK